MWNLNPTIGVVGGAGPQAGVSLVAKIYEESPSPNDQGHPRVHLISSPADLPDRSAFLMGLSSLNPAFGFAKVLSQLSQAGATVAGIACVTAHAPRIFSRIEALMGPRPELCLLSMIAELQAEIRAKGYQRVGVLSTKGTFQAGLFGLEFAASSGAEILTLPTPAEREAVHQAIYKVKASSQSVPAAARDTILQNIESLRRQDIDSVLLACTELPLAMPESEWEGLPVIDPLRVLARALLRHGGVVAPLDRRPSRSCQGRKP